MEILKINMKNFNFYTIISILFLIAGLINYFIWVARFGVVFDIGIYSITIVFILAGIIGFILSLWDKSENE
jgi:hypothetical protein